MKVAGIVCEYNPLHNGHIYHINQTRVAGATHIVCAMSGNFVQRGEPAFLDKWARAELAVKSGADLVVETLVPWAVSGAESFARGSISLLYELGIDMLSFGCEDDDVETMKRAMCALKSQKVFDLLKSNAKSGMNYPTALHKAISSVYDSKVSDYIASPNNILAIEYMKNLDDKIEVCPIKRVGVNHDEKEASDSFMSASTIRVLDSLEKCKDFVPKDCYELLKEYKQNGLLCKSNEKYEQMVLFALRSMTAEEMGKYLIDSTGLSDRVYDASRKATSLDELYEKIKTKNVTLAKVRRTVLNMVLKVPSFISYEEPTYIRVLAANEKGLEVLSRAKKTSTLPIVTKHSEIEKLDKFSKIIYDTQCRSTDLYCLMTEKNRACSKEQTSSMIIVR